MSHTPGPWRVTKLIPVYSTEDQDYPGAQVSWTEIEADGSTHKHDAAVEVWSERAEANARLIAAAPDMFEALQRSALATQPQCDGEHSLPGAACDCVGNAVRAALAKAEGRQ